MRGLNETVWCVGVVNHQVWKLNANLSDGRWDKLFFLEFENGSSQVLFLPSHFFFFFFFLFFSLISNFIVCARANSADERKLLQDCFQAIQVHSLNYPSFLFDAFSFFFNIFLILQTDFNQIVAHHLDVASFNDQELGKQ